MKQIKNVCYRHISLLTSVAVVLLWQLFGWYQLLPKFILPTPLAILNAYRRDFHLLFFHFQATLVVSLIGLCWGVFIGVLLAVLMDTFQLLKKMLYPILVVTQTIPTIALAPILVLWLGYGILPKVVLIVLTTVFPIVINVLDGCAQTDNDLRTLFQLMKASKWQLLVHLKIPFALPYFFAGLKVSVSYAFIASVVSEWLGGFEGLGVYMIRAKKLFQYDTMFAIIVLVSVMSIASMRLVTRLEKKIIKW